MSFHSSNAKPVYLEFCAISGGRSSKSFLELSIDDIARGYVDVSRFEDILSKKIRYVKVHFESEYGRVINKPLKWK